MDRYSISQEPSYPIKMVDASPFAHRWFEYYYCKNHMT